MAKLTQRIAEKVKVRNIPALIRQNTLGIIFLLGALFIWLVFVRTTTADMRTLFVMTPGGSISAMPNITFNSLLVLKALAIICGVLGVYQIVRGFGKSCKSGSGNCRGPSDNQFFGLGSQRWFDQCGRNAQSNGPPLRSDHTGSHGRHIV